MLRGVFVTGTDTGVGKTACAAALMLRYRTRGTRVSDTYPTPKDHRDMWASSLVSPTRYGGPDSVSDRCPTPRLLRYWKPVQTGIEQDDDTAEVGRLLGHCDSSELLDRGVRLEHPVSPHLAARLAGQRLDLDAIVEPLRDEPPGSWVVEGAGGTLVPLNDSTLMIDLMVRLGLPVVVAARSTLGTINHTLLTLAALRARSLTVAGVIMVGPPDRDNRDAVETYGQVRVVGEMPRFERLNHDVLSAWAHHGLDPSRCLDACFA